MATYRGDSLRARLDSGNCFFRGHVGIVDVDVCDVYASVKRIVEKHTHHTIVILDTGADLVFGALLARHKVPSLAIGTSLMSYFKILDRAHASRLVDAYDMVVDESWEVV